MYLFNDLCKSVMTVNFLKKLRIEMSMLNEIRVMPNKSRCPLLSSDNTSLLNPFPYNPLPDLF